MAFKKVSLQRPEPNGKTISEFFNVIDNDENSIAYALNAIDQVHGIPVEFNPPKCTIHFDSSMKENVSGLYHAKANKITINPNSPDCKVTVFHEVGHWLDDYAIHGTRKKSIDVDVNDLGLWQEAVINSIEYKALQELKLDVEKGAIWQETVWPDGRETINKINCEHLEIITRPHEIFARTYEQYIATVCGIADLEDEFRRKRTSESHQRYNTYWEPVDFFAIGKGFEDFLEASGWIKKRSQL